MIRNGVDIVEISRFSDMKNFEGFVRHTFTKREREYFADKKNPYQSVAGAFAAKEAFSKYMGSGFRGFGLRDVEVLHDELGKPYILFMGERVNADLSISHSETYAAATVCGEEYPMGGRYAELIKSYAHLMPVRRADMHKGDCGRVFIAAGSLKMSGAACLCANAAIRSGSGLVTLAIPDCIQQTAAAKLTEVMTMPISSADGMADGGSIDDIRAELDKCDACAAGPGLGRGSGIPRILKEFINCGAPCVIDADGLNALSENLDLLSDKAGGIIITPHPGEMERLCGEPVPADDEGRCRIASEFSKEYGVVTVLKGHRTVIASPDGELHINESGNAGMASGGMGDVLTGIIVSLCGQGLTAYNAALLGVFIHGLAGDLAAAELGEFGMIAGDVIGKLPHAVRVLAQNV